MPVCKRTTATLVSCIACNCRAFDTAIDQMFAAVHRKQDIALRKYLSLVEHALEFALFGER